MGATNERLQLSIEGRASGIAEIEKLGVALNKITDATLKSAQTLEKLASQAESDGKRIAGAAGGINSAFTTLSGTISQYAQTQLGAGAGAVNLATKLVGLNPAALGIASGFAAASVAALSFASHAAEAARSAELLAARTGLSVTGAQLWSRAAQVAGVEAESLQGAMRKLSQALADGGEEGRKGREALQKLGVSAYEVATGQLRPMDQILPEIFRKLGDVANVANRNAMAVQLLGRGALELAPLFGS